MLPQFLALNLAVAAKLSPTKRHRVVSGANQAGHPITALAYREISPTRNRW
jgi:hypothetical protein